jgi:predicted N-acetyltransferase YhbS
MIFDVVLLPEYQGKGLGKEIMKFLADRTNAPKVLLYVAPGKEGFYSKLGYREMKAVMIKYSIPELEQRHQ